MYQYKEYRFNDRRKQNWNYPIVVHSHLHWDWVWQWPQQFLSRLSAAHPILFIESPRWENSRQTASSRVYQTPWHSNVFVQQIFMPEQWRDNQSKVDREARRLMQESLGNVSLSRFQNPVRWYYDPMAFGPYTDLLDDIAVVYDCMDELSKFRFANPNLVERERALLNRADVVFAGGRKMWESKRRFNSNCHCFGCGVDIEHFGKARDAKTNIPNDVDRSRPYTLGFFGVVDERMDYELMASLADACPDCTIAVVGPHTKINEEDLPQRPNLQWMGGREYSELPAYAKAFDVCLMPFAMNEATEYINPTITLEYMATGKPVVSTAVEDVVRGFGSFVKIANSHDEFIAHCRALIEKPDQAMVERGLRLVEQHTWEKTVGQLQDHIDNAISKQAKLEILNMDEAVLNGVATNGVTKDTANGNGRSLRWPATATMPEVA